MLSAGPRLHALPVRVLALLARVLVRVWAGHHRQQQLSRLQPRGRLPLPGQRARLLHRSAPWRPGRKEPLLLCLLLRVRPLVLAWVLALRLRDPKRPLPAALPLSLLALQSLLQLLPLRVPLRRHRLNLK